MRVRLQAKYTLSIMAVILLVALVLAATLYFKFRETTEHIIAAGLQLLDESHEKAMVEDGMEMGALSAQPTRASAKGDGERVEQLLRTVVKAKDVVYATAVDRSGRVFEAGTPNEGTLPPASVTRPEVIQQEGITTITLPVHRGEMTLGSVRIGVSPASQLARHLGMEESLRRLQAASSRDQLIAVGAAIASLMLAGFLVAGIMARRFSRPIRALAISARAFAHSDRTTPSPKSSGNDEIAELAEAFSTMRTILGRTTTSQEFLHRIIDSLHEGLIVTSAKGEIRLANRTVTQMFGYSVEELHGRPFSGLVAQPQKFAVVAASEQQVSECWFLHRDGRLMPIAVSRSLLGEAENADCVYILRDIAERKRLEDELWLYRSRLEQLVVERTKELTAAIQELESFSYSVSHDLHAPLRAINGFGAALSEDYHERLDDTGKDYLDRMGKATVRMGQLIDGLLSLSRVVRVEIRKDEVDLSTLASEVAEEIAVAEKPRQATFRIAPHLQTQGDPALLRLLLQNLFSNAWKFTKHRSSALIEFGSALIENQTVFFVRDNGAGFDPALAQQLFQPFHRLHDADDFPGTGIGLATAQRIIQRHRGQIWADAEPKVGATFFFSLPREATIHVEERRVSGLAPLS
jgi:PAS domain S-box-containing protein